MRYLALLITSLFFIACKTEHKENPKVIFVSLLPQKYIVEHIAGSAFEVNCLVPAGVAPETYDPPPKLMMKLQQAKLLFISGNLFFENRLLEGIKENNDSLRVVSFSRDIICSEDSSHNHGCDPHTWCSPKQMEISANTVLQTLKATYPEYADTFNLNYKLLKKDLDQLNSLAEKLLSNNLRSKFLIFHPTLTYLARDYHLEQVSIEVDGKEASIKHLQEMIDMAKKENIKTLFVQKEFPASSIENIVHEFNGKIEVIDPLSENWYKEMERTIKLLNSALNE